jgi:hypothetical protein
MNDCDRCRKSLAWPNDSTTLLGETHARLCEACRTDWHAYCLTLPEYVEWRNVQAHKLWLEGRATAGNAPTLSEWQEYLLSQEHVMQRFFALGQAWLCPPIPAP